MKPHLETGSASGVVALLCSSLALASAACGAPSLDDEVATEASELVSAPTPLIVNLDSDFDDTAALAYLAQAHKQGLVDLRAVTVTNNGAGLPGMAIHHARCTLAAAGLSHIPIADNGLTIGPNLPSVVLRAGVQAVLTQTFPTCTESLASSAIPAAQLMADAAMAADAPVILTLGPLTNLAAALAREPALRDHVAAVYSMAGAVYVPGELVGEWMLLYDGSQGLNEWVNPPAIDASIRALGSKFWLVPGDATDYVPMSTAYAARLQAEATTPEGQIVASIANSVFVNVGLLAGLTPYWWDPLAAMSALGVNVVGYSDVRIKIVLSGPKTGKTQAVATGGTLIHVGLTGNRALFEDTFVETLNP